MISSLKVQNIFYHADYLPDIHQLHKASIKTQRIMT